MDKIWYGVCAIGEYPKILLQFSATGENKMADEELCEVGSTKGALALGSFSMYGNHGCLGHRCYNCLVSHFLCHGHHCFLGRGGWRSKDS
jgi:hypothetical protein